MTDHHPEAWESWPPEKKVRYIITASGRDKEGEDAATEEVMKIVRTTRAAAKAEGRNEAVEYLDDFFQEGVLKAKGITVEALLKDDTWERVLEQAREERLQLKP